MPSGNYSIVRQAILDKRIVVAMYGGYQREMCPHVIGYKGGSENALFFQFGGGSKTGLPPGGEWRCIHLDELSIIEVKEGPWRTGESHSRPQTCVDQVDIEVPC